MITINYKDLDFSQWLTPSPNEEDFRTRNIHKEEAYLKKLKPKQRKSIRDALKKLANKQTITPKQKNEIDKLFTEIDISDIYELKKNPFEIPDKKTDPIDNQDANEQNAITENQDQDTVDLEIKNPYSAKPKLIEDVRETSNYNKEYFEKPLYKSIYFWIISIIVLCILFQFNPFTNPPISSLLGQDDFYDKIGIFLKSIMLGVNVKIFTLVLFALWGLNTHRNHLLKDPEIKRISKITSIILCIWITPFVLYYIFVFISIIIFLWMLINCIEIFTGTSIGSYEDREYYDLDRYNFPEDKYLDNDYSTNDDNLE